MSQHHQDEPIIRQVELVLAMLKRRHESDAGSGRPTIRPIRSWDEQTRHLRFADKVKLHRYPGGLANTTKWRRDQMLAAYRKRIEEFGEPECAESQAIQEAMAYAIDAERFLGSLDQRDDRDYFPVHAVDDLAVHVLVWLEERGFQVKPLPKE